VSVLRTDGRNLSWICSVPDPYCTLGPNGILCPMYGLWEVCRPALAPVKLFIVALACIFAFLSVAIWRAFSFMCAPLSPCVFWPDVFGVGVRILGGRVGWRRLRTVAISGRRYSLHYIIHAKFSPQSLPSLSLQRPFKKVPWDLLRRGDCILLWTCAVPVSIVCISGRPSE